MKPKKRVELENLELDKEYLFTSRRAGGEAVVKLKKLPSNGHPFVSVYIVSGTLVGMTQDWIEGDVYGARKESVDFYEVDTPNATV